MRKVSIKNLFQVEAILTFFVGISLGRMGFFFKVGDMGPSKGHVLHIDDIPIRSTVHVDDKGREITKQQFLEPFVIPNFTGFSVATFLPGQTMLPPHEHETMHEIFYVVSGSGVFQINEVDNEINPGTFLHIAPKERHGIWVPDDFTEPLKMVVIGVAVGEKK